MQLLRDYAVTQRITLKLYEGCPESSRTLPIERDFCIID